jgi:membrane-associated phospholipid phosphatase
VSEPVDGLRPDSSPLVAPLTPSALVPGQSLFGPAVDRFDARADELLERLRGHPAADQLFLAATHLGDFSLIWHIIGVTRGLIRRKPDEVIVLAAMLGVESLIVNQGVKRLFRRDRPTMTGDDRLVVRRPRTSSFPSGHASSASFAATVLSSWDGRRLGALWFGIAAIVGTSRAYVRIHHASDVVGGAVVGTLLGLIGRRLARRLLAR